MLEILIDTNFIMECVSNKVDFFEDLKLKGFKILIPEEVILELNSILKSSEKNKFRQNAEIALKLLNNESFEKIKLGKGNVDDNIVKFLKANSKIYLATMDKDLKKRILNPKIVVRSRKKLEKI
ncbi:MAG: PIN domain-containing protein [Candidatus Pacearchaeota archaeon]|jgi:rRNA-processing protein FCF1